MGHSRRPRDPWSFADNAMLFLRLAFLAVVLLGCVRHGPYVEPTPTRPVVIQPISRTTRNGRLCVISSPRPRQLSARNFYAYVRYISDEKYAGMDCPELVHSLPDNYPGFFCFVADLKTLTDEGHPVLVVGFSPKSGKMEDYQRFPKRDAS